MADETKKDNLESENQGNGGETVDNQTTVTMTDAERAAKAEKIAEDQRKRAEIAEAKLAEATKGEETKITNTPAQAPDVLTRDEAILIARGYSDEALAQAKKISKGADVPLLEALKDPLMTAFLEKEAEEKRKAEAHLGASNGSGATPPKEIPLDDEGHKNFWKEKMGQ